MVLDRTDLCTPIVGYSPVAAVKEIELQSGEAVDAKVEGGTVAAPSPPCSHLAMNIASFPWLSTALFLPPNEACRLSCICKPVKALFDTLSVGRGAWQKYWYSATQRLLSITQDGAAASVSSSSATMSTTEGKKNWKVAYGEAWTSHCKERHTARHVSRVALAEAFRKNGEMHAQLALKAQNDNENHLVENQVEEVDEDTLHLETKARQQAVFQGLEVEWKSARRSQYKQTGKSKPKNKHMKGQDRAWAEDD